MNGGSNNVELKPCPFCGGVPELEQCGESFRIFCGCCISTEWRTSKEAIANRWNTRTEEK